MSIVIKELFKSDLDQYNQNWWSSKKVEKLNFNFDQIALSGGGPSGPSGFSGDQGLDGNKGPTGIQGPIGFQGFIGPKGNDGVDTWKVNKSSTVDYITLKPNHASKIHPNTVIIGIKDDSTLYDSLLLDSVKTINTNGFDVNNIIFSTDENDVEVYLNLYQGSNNPTFKKSFNTINNNIFVFSASQHFFATSISTTSSIPVEYVEITDSIFKVKTTDSYFGTSGGSQITELKLSTRFNTSNPQNKWIAQSETVDGKIKWVNPVSVIPGFPVGSIIGIRYEDFINSSNFWKDESIVLETQLLQNRDGSGKINTQYEGWYLCNGETWKKGAISFKLPNLNSYSYNIQSANNSHQGDEDSQTQNLSVLSGANLDFNLDLQENVQYSSSYSLETWNTSLDIFNSQLNASSFANSKMVYICFLGEKEMYWETIAYQAPDLYSISLTYGISPAAACASTSNSTYLIDFDLTSWTITSNNLNENVLYNLNGTNTASAGWYTYFGISRYWSGTAFINTIPCKTYYELTTRYSSSVYGLNGLNSPYHNSVSSPVYSDEISFINSTKLYTSSSATTFAQTGWYRVGNERRFWNFNTGTFLGISISSSFIINLMNGTNNLAPYNTNTYGAQSPSMSGYCNGLGQVIWLYTNSGNNFGDNVNLISDVFTNADGFGSEGEGPLILVPAYYYYSPNDTGASYARYSNQNGYLTSLTYCSTSGGGGGGGGGQIQFINGEELPRTDGGFDREQIIRF